MKKYISIFLTMFSVHAFSADPSSGEVSESSAQMAWTGGPLLSSASATCSGPDNPLCDNFTLTITPPAGGYDFEVKVVLNSSLVDDYDLEIYDPDGNLAASSGNSAGSEEAVVVTNPMAGDWTVSASPYLVIGPYEAVANFSQIQGSGGNVTSSNVSSFLNYGPPGANGIDVEIYGPVSGEEGVGLGAGEPTIGVPVANNLDLQLTEPTLSRSMYIAGLETLRVTFDDSTSPAVADWQDKSVPTHLTTLDPILETDPLTGRTLSSQLAGKISLMSFSDDDGETWTISQGAGINSGADHQTVGSGPFSENDPLPQLFPSAVYYASQDIAVAQLAASHDGGQTFGLAIPMYNLTECGGLHGHIQVSADGTVYVPNKNCGGEQGVAKSLDGGLTFSVHTVPGTQSSSSDPSAATGSDETLYLGMCNNSTTPLISVSSDKGDSWSAPVDVGQPYGIVNCAFPEVIAGDGDRAAFAFLGSSTQGSGTTANPNFEGIWHMYVSLTYDRGVSWETTIVTPGDPVQRGAVCLSGTTCESGRNLLDFNDIEIDEKGRVLIAYSDGCVGSCIDGVNNSGTDVGRIARQQRGTKGMLSAFDEFMQPSMGNVPDNPYFSALNFVDVNELSWTEPYNGESDILSYNIYRRDEMGAYGGPMTSVPASELGFTDSGNISGNNYCYKVTAVNAIGESNGFYETCAEAPIDSNVCELPGAARANDAQGDQLGAANLDVLQLFTAEPFFGDPMDCNTASDEKIIFTMNVGDSTVTNGNAWIIMWNRHNPISNGQPVEQTYDRNMVSMRIVGTEPVCHIGMITAPSINQGDDIGAPLAVEDCQLKDTGEITISVDKSLILDKDCDGANCAVEPANYSLDGLEVRTFVNNLSGEPVTQSASSDYSTALSYSFVGNNSCRIDVEPIANPDVGESYAKSFMIQVLANDASGDCDGISISSPGVANYGTVTIENSGTTIMYRPIKQIVGEDVFNYEITDDSGNTSRATVTVIESSDIIYWDGFND